MRVVTVAAAVCMSIVGLSVAEDVRAAIRMPTKIGAQELGPALQAFAQHRDMQVLYFSGVVKDLRTNGASGDLTIDEALQALLSGTGLTYQYISDKAVTILPIATSPRDAARAESSTPAPANGAPVKAVPRPQTQSSFWDRFRLSQAPGASPASDNEGKAQGTGRPAGENQSPAALLEEVVVTGTHLRGMAPESSPVLVFTRDDIEASGQTTVEQFMRTVPQNFSGGPNQENFNSTFSGADVTEQGASVNLRGLGQRATLVLVNGRRLAPSGYAGSYVDVSLIPISAVERIEVLTNGASAIYGSDAVGGVVNFVLRDDFSGVETSVHAASATKGDGDQLLVSPTVGWSWGSGHGLVTYEYRSEDAVLAGDRDFTVGVPAASFFLPQERRHSVFAALTQDLTDRLSLDVSGSFSTRDTVRDFIPSTSPLLVSADADSTVYSIGASLNYQLPNQWRLQGSASFSRNDAASSQFETGGIGVINDGDFVNELGEAGLKLDGDLFSLPAGAVKLAVGVQYRREEHASGFITASQIMAGTPRTQRAASRDIRAGYAELLVPFFSPANRFAGMERLELSAAARHERYSDFGDATDPKLGVLWSPLPGLGVRGTWGTSFRAPLLTESLGQYNVYYWPNTASLYAGPGDPQAGVGVVLRVLGQNPSVAPETSETWTAGMVWQPESLRGLALTMDYFSTRYSDRIASPTPTISRIIGDPAFDAIVHRNPSVDEVNRYLAGAADVQDVTGPGFTSGGAGPSSVSIILDTRVTNSAITKTSGIDATAGYAFSVDAHQIGLRASLTRLLSFDDQLTASSAVTEGMDRPYRPNSLRANAGVTWGHRGWSSSVLFNYVDSYSDPRFVPTRRVGSFDYVDLNLAYRMGPSAPTWLRGTRVALSILNLFDTQPPSLSPDPGQVRSVGYDPVNASGRGRFVGLQLRKLWGDTAGTAR